MILNSQYGERDKDEIIYFRTKLLLTDVFAYF
jgi:hypothetical protein